MIVAMPAVAPPIAMPNRLAESATANVDGMLKPFANDAVVRDNASVHQGHAEIRTLLEEEVIPVKAIFSEEASKLLHLEEALHETTRMADLVDERLDHFLVGLGEHLGVHPQFVPPGVGEEGAGQHAPVRGAVVGRADGLPGHPRRGELLFAAREHDNGWTEVDAYPTVDPDTGRPYDCRFHLTTGRSPAELLGVVFTEAGNGSSAATAMARCSWDRRTYRVPR